MSNQVPTAAKLKELRRELALRRNVYPNMVAKGTLDQKEADWRIEIVESMIADYEQQQRKDRPLPHAEYIKGRDFD